MLLKSDKKFTVPPKIKFAYENFKPIEETASFRVFEAKHRSSKEKHTIRILDSTKEFVKNHSDHAATLFIQELLRLQYLCPGSVLINTFEVSEDGKNIACALPYATLNLKFEGTEEVIDPRDSKIIEKLL